MNAPFRFLIPRLLVAFALAAALTAETNAPPAVAPVNAAATNGAAVLGAVSSNVAGSSATPAETNRSAAPAVPTPSVPPATNLSVAAMIPASNAAVSSNAVRASNAAPRTAVIPKGFQWGYAQSNNQGVLSMEHMKIVAPYKLSEINYGSIIDSLNGDLNNAVLWYNDAIRFEGQFGLLTLTGTNGVTAPAPVLLFKMNLGNAKRPRIAEVNAALTRIDERLWAHGLTVSPAMRERLAQIHEGAQNYPTDRWIRPSIAVFVPFQSTNADPTALQSDGLTRYFRFNQAGLAVGWDLFDYATVYAGLDANGRFIAGGGLDVTTAAYSLSGSFATFVKQLFRVPN